MPPSFYYRPQWSPDGEGAREITVVPTDEEEGVRTCAWVEDNRRRSRRPPTDAFPTCGAEYGVIIDERFDGGGSAADYMVDTMARELHGFFNNPIGDRDPFTTPGADIWGPKVIIINEAAGSGGDLLPYMFKRMDLGPLVGRRTWGQARRHLGHAAAHRRRLFHCAPRGGR